MANSDVRILGVEHTNEAIHEPIDAVAEEVDGPDVVYHERQESMSRILPFIGWGLLKSPFGLMFALPKAAIAAVSMRRGLSTEGSTAELKFECQLAAERIRDQHGATLENIGVNRTELFKRRSWPLAAGSWALALSFPIVLGFVVVTVLAALSATLSATFSSANLLLVVVAAVTLVLWTFLAGSFEDTLHNKIRPGRDDHMTERIYSDLSEREAPTALVIVGENHVSGIAARLQARGVESECRWLATEADVATPADA